MRIRISRFRFRIGLEHLLMPLFLLGFLGLWRLLVFVGRYPPYLLPAPEDVGRRFLSYAAGGQYYRHLAATLIEVLGGFFLGAAAGMVLGYPVAKIRALERIAVPYIVAWQSVPVVALAPLMIIWFGTGYWSKILVVAMITFFPVLINAVMGFRAIEREYLRLMASLNASRSEVFFKIEVPRALPTLFTGFRIAAPLAVVGAVVGEFLGASRGLGFLIRISQGLLDTPLMFVALFTLVFLGIAFYLLFVLIEKLTMHQVRYF